MYVKHIALLSGFAGLLVGVAVAAQGANPDRVALAAAHLKAGNLKAAEEQLRQAVTHQSRDPEVYNLLGFVCDQTGRPEEARQHFLRALQLNPDFHRARNNLGAHYFRTGKLDLAEEQFRKSFESNSGDVTASHNLGLIYLSRGDAGQALRFLERAQALAPQDSGILFNLARCYFALQRSQDGTRLIQQLLAKTASDDGATLYAAGVLLLQNQQVRPAIETLERARELSPANPAVLVALAEALRQAEQTEEAWRRLDESIGLLKQTIRGQERQAEFLPQAVRVARSLQTQDPNSYKKTKLLAEILFLERKYSESQALLRKLQVQGSRDPDYLNLLGLVHGGLNQLPEAVEAVIQAIRLAPQRSDLIFNLAGLYQKAGDNASAVKVLKQALAEGKASAEIHFALGLSYFNQGNFSQAVQSFRESVKLSPGFYRAYFDLGRSLAKLSRFPQAAKAYQQALASNPNFPQAHYELALLLSAQQQNSAAIRHLTEAIRIQPSYGEARYQLGKLYLQQGQIDAAVVELETVIAGNPDHDGAYSTLARIHRQQGNKAKAEQLLLALNERKQQRKAAFEKKVSANP